MKLSYFPAVVLSEHMKKSNDGLEHREKIQANTDQAKVYPIKAGFTSFLQKLYACRKLRKFILYVYVIVCHHFLNIHYGCQWFGLTAFLL